MQSDHPIKNSTSLALSPAPLWRRFAAMGYDLLLVLAISMAYGAITQTIHYFLTGSINHDYAPQMGGVIFQAGWLLCIGAFYVFFWMRAGQTVGMKAWRLKLVSNNNQPLAVANLSIRYFVSIFSLLAFGLGYFWALVDKQGRTLHCIASKTNVLVTPKVKK